MSSSIDPVLLIPSYVHPFPNPVRFPIQMVPKDGPNARPRKKPRWTHLIHQLQKALGPGRRMLRALSRAFLGFAGWSGFVLKKRGNLHQSSYKLSPSMGANQKWMSLEMEDPKLTWFISGYPHCGKPSYCHPGKTCIYTQNGNIFEKSIFCLLQG